VRDRNGAVSLENNDRLVDALSDDRACGDTFAVMLLWSYIAKVRC